MFTAKLIWRAGIVTEFVHELRDLNSFMAALPYLYVECWRWTRGSLLHEAKDGLSYPKIVLTFAECLEMTLISLYRMLTIEGIGECGIMGGYVDFNYRPFHWSGREAVTVPTLVQIFFISSSLFFSSPFFFLSLFLTLQFTHQPCLR
jgi:hypothetical protein